MSMHQHIDLLCLALASAAIGCVPSSVQAQTSQGYLLYVSNEKSGDVTVIDAGEARIHRPGFRQNSGFYNLWPGCSEVLEKYGWMQEGVLHA